MPPGEGVWGPGSKREGPNVRPVGQVGDRILRGVGENSMGGKMFSWGRRGWEMIKYILNI